MQRRDKAMPYLVPEYNCNRLFVLFLLAMDVLSEDLSKLAVLCTETLTWSACLGLLLIASSD
jgi:hypothetical protein